jgi:hypothetical protein
MNCSKIISLMACVLLMLPGCGSHKTLHRSRSLDIFKPQPNYQDHKNNVSIGIRELGSKDCVKLFGYAGRRLVSKTQKPFVPLHLSITNHSDETYLLDPKNISLPLVDAQTVANRLKPSVAFKTMGMIAGGAIITTIAATTGAGLLFLGATFASVPLFVSGIVTCASGATIFLIGTPLASAAKGFQTVKERRAISDDVCNKTLMQEVHIEPNQTIDTLIFVPLRTMKRNFTITLENRYSQEDTITFAVEMIKK